ncbi:hypothetical protein BKA69DRAFT_258431 [Paraphysoderma sedebokerense]|nr:hypothetical protein BKA69DRAFT_258431 [Paraphysoderma sedebokerense]
MPAVDKPSAPGAPPLPSKDSNPSSQFNSEFQHPFIIADHSPRPNRTEEDFLETKDLEAAFCKNFSCCGIVLRDLYELLVCLAPPSSLVCLEMSARVVSERLARARCWLRQFGHHFVIHGYREHYEESHVYVEDAASSASDDLESLLSCKSSGFPMDMTADPSSCIPTQYLTTTSSLDDLVNSPPSSNPTSPVAFNPYTQAQNPYPLLRRFSHLDAPRNPPSIHPYAWSKKRSWSSDYIEHYAPQLGSNKRSVATDTNSSAFDNVVLKSPGSESPSSLDLVSFNPNSLASFPMMIPASPTEILEPQCLVTAEDLSLNLSSLPSFPPPETPTTLVTTDGTPGSLSSTSSVKVNVEESLPNSAASSSEVDNRTVCPVPECSKSYKNTGSLRVHIASSHADWMKQQKPPTPQLPPQTLYINPICAASSSLTPPTSPITVGNPTLSSFPVSTTDRFPSKAQPDGTKTKKEKRDKIFSCLYKCGKQYSSLGGLKYHLVKAHNVDSTSVNGLGLAGLTELLVHKKSLS